MLTVLGGLAEFERELIRTRTGEGRERPAHAARVGAGEVGACDQRIGRQRAPLIGPQRLALPFARLALGSVQPRPWYRDLDRPKRAGQRPPPAAVAMSGHASSFFFAGRLASPITRAGQYRVELAMDQFFDELPSPITHRRLDRIEPIVEKLGSRLGFTLQGIGLRDSAGHGVVSGPAL